jgi:hypothetical protein
MSIDEIKGRGDAGGIAPEPVDPLDSLPPPDTRRWVPRRKAEVVAAVRDGLLTLEQACERYQLSAEEFSSWERLIDRHGLGGLRVTRLKTLRASADPRRA